MDDAKEAQEKAKEYARRHYPHSGPRKIADVESAYVAGRLAGIAAERQRRARNEALRLLVEED